MANADVRIYRRGLIELFVGIGPGAALSWLGRLQQDGFLALLCRKLGRWNHGDDNFCGGLDHTSSMGLVSVAGCCRVSGNANGGSCSGADCCSGGGSKVGAVAVYRERDRSAIASPWAESQRRKARSLCAFRVWCAGVAAPGLSFADVVGCSQGGCVMEMPVCDHPSYLCGFDSSSSLLSQVGLSWPRHNDLSKSAHDLSIGEVPPDASK